MLLNCLSFVNQDCRADSVRVDCSKGCSWLHLNTVGNFVLMRLCSQIKVGYPAADISHVITFQGCQSEVNDLHIKFFFFLNIEILCVV